jgi:hypothetical protein
MMGWLSIRYVDTFECCWYAIFQLFALHRAYCVYHAGILGRAIVLIPR